MIYGTAHRVRTNPQRPEVSSQSGVNASMYRHGPDQAQITMTPNAVAEDIRGELLEKTVHVTGRGNSVDSYLDVVGPDAILGDPERLRAVLEGASGLIDETSETQTSREFVHDGVGIRLFVSHRIRTSARAEFEKLAEYLLHLSRRIAHRAVPPVVIRRSLGAGVYRFHLEGAGASDQDLTIDAEILEVLEQKHGSFLPIVPTLLLSSTADVDVEIRNEDGHVLWATRTGVQQDV